MSALKSRKGATKLVMILLKRLVNVPSELLDEEIERILGMVAKYIGNINRVALFRLAEDREIMFLSHEWVSDARYALKTMKPAAHVSAFASSFFLWGSTPGVGNVDGCDGENLKFSSFLPVISRSRLTGSLVLQSFTKEKRLDRAEMQFLTMVGDLLTSALHKAAVDARERDLLVKEKALLAREKAILERENAALKELDAFRQEFIATTTHELKTPLVSIYSASNFLLGEYREELGSNAMELVEMISRGGRRLLDLIADMLDVTRLESNKVELRFEKQGIDSLVEGIIANLQRLIEERQHVVSVSVSPEHLTFVLDPARMDQVFTNLVSNAIKYTPPGGTIEVNVRLSKKNELVATVRDNGVGFAPGDKEHLFTKFGKIETREGAAGTLPGTGLGLYIAKQIVELHGGEIHATSPGRGRGRGSTFTLVLPPRAIPPGTGEERSLPVARDGNP